MNRQRKETPYAFLRRKMVVELWGENFAELMADEVVENDLVMPLLDMAESPRQYALDKLEAEKLAFRAAYVMEHLCFEYPDLFYPLQSRFFDSFASAYNGSVMRHWAKILVHILKEGEGSPTDKQVEQIVQACADWVLNPKVRVAVKVHAMDVLFLLADRTDWVNDCLPDLISAFTQGNTPAVWAVMRRWKREGLLM